MLTTRFPYHLIFFVDFYLFSHFQIVERTKEPFPYVAADRSLHLLQNVRAAARISPRAQIVRAAG